MKINSFDIDNIGPDENAIILKKVDINYKGGNTATAKSDVTVQIVYNLSDIRLIEQTYKNTIKIMNNGKQILYKD